MACLMMKFFVDNREITSVKANQAAAQRCYNASLEIRREGKEDAQDNAQPLNSSKGHDGGP